MQRFLLIEREAHSRRVLIILLGVERHYECKVPARTRTRIESPVR